MMLKKLQNLSAAAWIKLAVFNFLLVGAFGLLMRLKFLFPMPWLDQKNIMHAHSHFAFSGWVTQALMVFMVMAIFRQKPNDPIPKKYQSILIANLIASYGMLIAFSINGYAFFSIACSFLAVLTSYWFCFTIWKDMGASGIPKPILIFFKASLIYHALSSLGTYALIYLKVTQQFDPLKQLASVYFYLHFQYNGWFFFACLALLAYWVFQHHGKSIVGSRFALLYVITAVPAYFLSVLWWKGFPSWLYMLLLITVLSQVGLWCVLLRRIIVLKRVNHSLELAKPTALLWLCVALAVCLKLILQAISIIPSLSQLVYGYRPIVIAYLHLVLLVIISLFILGYAFQSRSLKHQKAVQYAVIGLLTGIFFNEFFLMLQGLSGLLRIPIHGAEIGLAVAAVVIVFSISMLLIKQQKQNLRS